MVIGSPYPYESDRLESEAENRSPQVSGVAPIQAVHRRGGFRIWRLANRKPIVRGSLEVDLGKKLDVSF